MNRIFLNEDIKPISEFRANASTLLAQVRQTHRPLVITQNGHSAAVMLDVGDYEKLIQTIELQQDLNLAEDQIKNGQVKSTPDAKKQVLSRIRK